MVHNITHKGKDIEIVFNRGFNGRYINIPVVSNNFKRIYHKGHVIDAQREVFELIAYSIIVDANGDQIPNTTSTSYRVAITDGSYDQLYGLLADVNPAIVEMNMRAINGLLENEFGSNFYCYDPLNNLVPFQPVEFELSSFENDITVAHTDGSGNYQYSLDGGATWGDSSILIGLTPSQEYSVSVKDDTSNWFRTKKITLD